MQPARVLSGGRILTQADVVDVVDSVNITALEDGSERRSLTSLTPRLGVNIRLFLCSSYHRFPIREQQRPTRLGRLFLVLTSRTRVRRGWFGRHRQRRRPFDMAP